MTIETPTVPDLPTSNMSEVEVLVQFLSDRLAEKEAIARDALEYLDDGDGTTQWATAHYTHTQTSSPYSLFIRSRSPEQALAEYAAQRQIIATNIGRPRRKSTAPEHGIAWVGNDGPYVILIGHPGGEIGLDAGHSADFLNTWYELPPPNRTLKALALQFADHPDFNEAWRI